MTLTFQESISRLNGKMLSAQTAIQNKKIQFNIIPDVFCREWHEVSYLIDGDKVIIGRYVSKIEEAKSLCEHKYQELLRS